VSKCAGKKDKLSKHLDMFNKLDLLDLGCDAKHWFWLSFPGDISELSGRNSLSSMKRPIQRFLKHGPWTSSIGILLEI
jgi:hypothetical protein